MKIDRKYFGIGMIIGATSAFIANSLINTGIKIHNKHQKEKKN